MIWPQGQHQSVIFRADKTLRGTDTLYINRFIQSKNLNPLTNKIT